MYDYDSECYRCDKCNCIILAYCGWMCGLCLVCCIEVYRGD